MSLYVYVFNFNFLYLLDWVYFVFDWAILFSIGFILSISGFLHDICVWVNIVI